MWRNPKYQAEAPTRDERQPEETGERLATFHRQRGEELRLSSECYEGHGYLRLQLWAPNDRGVLWPVKGRSVSVRLREARALADALAKAVEDLDDAAPSDRQPAQRGEAGARGRRDDREAAPAAHRASGPYKPPGDEPQFVDRGRPERAPYNPGQMRGAADASPGFSEFDGEA